MEQLKPSHAEHLNLKKLKDVNNTFWIQQKYDGERILMHFDDDKVYMTSRRISKKTKKYVECQNNFECFKNTTGLKYTVLDGELFSKDWSTIVGMIHSLPERSKELQKENKPRYGVFDCLFYDGEDVRNKPYFERYELAKRVVMKLMNRQIFIVNNIEIAPVILSLKQLRKNISIESILEFTRDASVQAGCEGTVVKLKNAKYDDKDFMYKNKKTQTLDIVVYAIIEGRGKYKGMAGALAAGYYDKENNEIIHITNVNCGTDEDRKWWWDNFEKTKWPVIEVKCQEVTKTSLRHPVYLRRREDKDYTMCTKETIWTQEKK